MARVPSGRFVELDWQQTPMGEISLRRRAHAQLGVDVYEAKLGDEHLMSTLFTASEEALARLGLAEFDDEHGPLDVLVGGLGLGYTAVTALADPRVRHLVVVEALAPVVDWHRRRLLPLSQQLTADPRTELVTGDFFALARDGGLPGTNPAGRGYDALLVDIDHTPSHLLHPSHADLYTADGLARLREQLAPSGVFGLWSDAAADEEFLARQQTVFARARAERVEFANPLTGGTSSSTVYLARTAP
ncbi:spermidine synthase [Angustibacter peucedani]